jgi:peptide chain release factor subunit 1
MVFELSREQLKKLSAMQRYELRRRLEAMDKYSGRATELISLYVPPSKLISFVTSYLKNEYSQSSNIKSKSTRKNVMAAIESIISRLKTFKKPPENGIVFFIGHVATSGDQTSMVQHVIEPPLPITTFFYRCDSKFYLEPINNMLVDEDTYGLIVVDRSEATIGYLRGKRVEVVKYIPSRVPSKHGRGGQSQRRFERLIEIAAHEFFKKVGDLVNEAFLEEKHLRGILVGGPGATKDFFVDKNYLHHELKRKVIDLFDTGYTDEYGLRELVEKAAKALSDLDLMREKRFVQKLMNEIRKSDGGLSVYGEKPVFDAVKNGIVDTLLVSDGLRKYKLKYTCPNCGNIIEEVNSKKEGNLKSCPKCESEMTFDSGEDIIETLLHLSEAAGTKMELISADSAEGDMFLKAFGGMAGILRYKVAG